MEEPFKPTTVHYALIFFVLLSIISGMGWLLAYKGTDSIPDLRRQITDLRRQVNDLRQQLAVAKAQEATAKQVDSGSSNDKTEE